jgi:cobalt/nickel transport protein
MARDATRKLRSSALIVCALTAAIGCGWAYIVRDLAPGAEWPGVDEAVIGNIAQRAGRPEAEPLLRWVQGDLLLFMFLCAGLGAGFVLGYFARVAFVEQRESQQLDEHAA